MHIIKQLRERNNFSQKEISKRLGITRQTLIKYESGKTEFSTIAAKRLADIFQVSPDSIVNNVMPKELHYNVIAKKDDKEEGSNGIRISIPQNNIDKFKEVFIYVYVLNKVGAKSNVGQTVLYKLLCSIDFNYYKLKVY
ncbi:MAG: helix-turn-helix transcriptional regulator [Endomicrobium sp.]|jgi:transcriptional regulator with XRE-family HTH domain|nr:helix-turn-helix transcriptional regulator [Endomicrobium sp.]